MQQVHSNNFIKIALCFMLVAILALSGGLLMNSAEAAAKPSIETKMTIGTGSIVGDYDYYSREYTYSLNVSNADKKATYTFTSSNTKILTVKVKGSSAFLTGLKAGTATITCNQKLNGKTTKVGTCTVTIKNAIVEQDDIAELPLGPSIRSGSVIMPYRNNDATYTYTSNSKNFTMKEKISKFDGMEFVKHEFNATVAGTYTVTVKETYNKATRTVGTLKYIVKKATINPNDSIDLGDSIIALNLIYNARSDVNYGFYFDEKIIKSVTRDGTVYFEGIAIGSTDVKIYEVNAKSPDKSVLIGTCKLSVTEVVLEDLDIEFDDTEAWLGDGSVNLYVYKTPEKAPGEITITSSNTKVATVSALNESGVSTITPVSAGTTTITITCGNITRTQVFTVYGEEDED